MPFGMEHIVGEVPELPPEDVDDVVADEEVVGEEPVEEPVVKKTPPVVEKNPRVSACPDELVRLCRQVPSPCTILVTSEEHVKAAQMELDRLGRKDVKVCYNPRKQGNHPTWTR